MGRSLLCLLLAVAFAGCSGGSPASAPSTVTTANGSFDLTGTWVEQNGSLNFILKQTGNSVTGTSSFNDRNSVFGSYTGDGTLAGTISGNTLTMMETYGITTSTSGRDTSNCKELIQSTWTITSPTSMNGPFDQVDVCDGVEVFRKSGSATLQKR